MQVTNPQRYRGPIKLVVLDLSGTVLDYGCRAPAVAFVEVFKQYGVDLTVEQARRPMGLGKRDHIQALTRMDAIAGAWEEVHGHPVTDEDVDRIFADFRQVQLQVLPRYAKLIPGTLQTVAGLRERGIHIGCTTGYFTEAMALAQEEAARQGFVADSSVASTQVPAGRPAPWMVMQNMMNTGVFPPQAVVKVDDTPPGIAEGLNACTWTVGLAKTGNEVGLTLEEIEALSPDALERKLDRARDRLARSGAHYVVDGIGDLLPVIDAIEQRLARGER